jgi:hypothetical protein
VGGRRVLIPPELAPWKGLSQWKRIRNTRIAGRRGGAKVFQLTSSGTARPDLEGCIH